MATFAKLQRLVEQDRGTIYITIHPPGFPHRIYSKEGDTICVSAGNDSRFYGAVVCGTDLEKCIEEAVRRAITPASKPTTDLGDLLG